MRNYALIWDLDGTLVDSYPSIVPAAQEICSELGKTYSAEFIRDYVLRANVGALLEQTAAALGVDPAPVHARFAALNDTRIDRIVPMPRAGETLEALRRDGHASFVFTHRSASCDAILDRTGLAPYFTEVVTALRGFPRKPAPDGILYLMRKYSLDAARCFYVGDRRLDMEAAENAGIGGILYLPPDSPTGLTGRETAIVRDLMELPGLLRKNAV